MDVVKNGKEKQFAYRTEFNRLSKALEEEFYLEAVAISYAIAENRLVSFLHHAGIVTRTDGNLKINACVYPCMRRVLKKDDNTDVDITAISSKTKLISALLKMTEEKANAIDSSVRDYSNNPDDVNCGAKNGYMHALFAQMNKIDRKAAAAVLDSIKPWCRVRNQLIHALLNKTVASAYDAKKKCAQDGLAISRDIDKYLAKPFKVNNTLRKTLFVD